MTVMRSATRNTIHVVLHQQDGVAALEVGSRSSMRSVSSAPMPASGSSSSSTSGAVARHMAISSWRLRPWTGANQQFNCSPVRPQGSHPHGLALLALQRSADRPSCQATAIAPGREPAVFQRAELGVDGGALIAAAEAGACALRACSRIRVTSCPNSSMRPGGRRPVRPRNMLISVESFPRRWCRSPTCTVPRCSSSDHADTATSPPQAARRPVQRKSNTSSAVHRAASPVDRAATSGVAASRQRCGRPISPRRQQGHEAMMVGFRPVASGRASPTMASDVDSS